MAKNIKELEVKLTGAMAVLSALPEGAFLRALSPAGARWKRMASTDVSAAGTALASHPPPRAAIDRWRAKFTFKTSVLNLTIDLGRVFVGAGTAASFAGPYGGATLGLVKGDPADLFLATRLLLENAPLKLSARSMRQVAASIASGRQFAVPKFSALSASAEDTAGDVLVRALVTTAERIIQLQASILDARAPEGIQRMRVELRRFRSAERVFRRAADCPPLRRLAQQAGVYARALAPARDWDVFLDETVAVIAENEYAVAGFARLKATAYAYRANAWAAASAKIDDPGFSTFALDLLAMAHSRPWRSKPLKVPADIFAVRVLDRTLRRTREVARGIDRASPRSFHQLRIALKKLRYGVQLFRGLYPKESRKPYMAAMATMQEALGVLNDAVVAQKLANRAADGKGEKAMRAAGFICGYYAARAEAAAKEIDGAWIMFEKQDPFWRK